jgi:hypothetical protein
MRDPSDTRALAAGYATSHRIYEYGGVSLGSVCGLWLTWRLLQGPGLALGSAVIAIILGMLLADITSGTVHWMMDTWGTVRTPVVGALAIRTFREHHVDEKAMLQHDFIETNGHNCALSVILSGIGLYATTTFTQVYLITGAVFIAFTSQIHKWAHMDRPPILARVLQTMRIILSPVHHHAHHVAPHTRNYCITTGWLDGPLRILRVWEALEWTISLVSGAKPRQ